MIMKIKEEDKDLNYWKENCKEDYLHTPISVLRYITKLEEEVNNVVLDDVSISGAEVCHHCGSEAIINFGIAKKCSDCRKMI